MEPNTANADKFAIHAAAREGQTKIVESLLSANPKLASRRDDDDRLPIHWAISNNHQRIVELLVQLKDFDPDAKDGSGWTPLMIAASLKEAEPLVKLLLSKGADVNAKMAEPNFPLTEQDHLTCSFTPEHLTYMDPYMIPFLDSNGQTALHFCASKNNLQVAKLLIDHKATARVKDRRGQLPLHRAASVGSVPMSQLLLDNKSPINATDISGYTSLHHAIAEGHGDVAIFLLKNGADPEKRDDDGQLAIDLSPDQKVRSFVIQSAEHEGIDMN